ncbi:MAG: VanZ family protein [Planctomycetaceae bacterium]
MSAQTSQRIRLGVTIVLVAYWLTLFISTHIPMPDLGDLPDHSDKVMHFVAYAGLSLLLGIRWSLMSPLTWRARIIIFSITVGYAVIDELLQTIPALHRTGDIYDVLADACGSLIGLMLLVIIQPVTNRLRKRL